MKKEFSAKLNELEEQYNALKEQLELLFKMEELKADLEKSKERILEKEDEIKELKKQIEQENELNDDQLAVIRDEIRTELVNSGEFGCNDDEFKRLKEKVSVLEEEKRTEQTEREKLFELVKQLQTDNEHLNEQVKEFNDKTNSEANASEDDESNTSYNLKIERLMNDLREREKRIDQMEETQKRTKEEFESHLEERVEEETLKVTTMYEAKFEEVKREAEQERKKLGEEIVFLKEDSKAKSEQIEDLHSRVKNLLHEVTTIRAELDKKNIEIKNFSKKTDEYLRRRDNQQAQVLERRIINLNKEHEKTIDLMKEHEMELAAKLRKLQEEIRNKPELVSDGIQTDDLPQLKKETHQYSTQEQQTEPNEEELSTKIEELNNALKEKDEVIAHLREELFNQPCYEGSEHEGKKNRSQSVATGEHMAMCQRAASKFQTLVSQMTEKKDRSKLKNIDKVNAEGTNTECVELAKNKKDKEKEKKETEKEQDKREKEREREKERASKSSGTIHRAKSPSLLTRLRDRSPAKAKSPTMEMKTNDEKKHLLSPADAERTTVVEDRRRVSPSRQLFTRSKRDSSSQSTAALSPSLSKEESTKRPAWKF
uniref:Tag-278 n=1 Tax=Ascaris suum TaxID=6253 RepID=F1KVC8_ASCSU